MIIITSCGGSADSKSASNCYILDKDRDQDGFADVLDAKPDEPFENGKFANLENVVNSEGVKRILKIAKDRGTTINLQLGNNPPNIKGIYKTETGGNVVYARNSIDGRTTGDVIMESETRLCTSKGYSAIDISHPDVTKFARGVLKGEGKYFSIYGLTSYPRSSGCMLYKVTIRNGKIDSKSGDIKNFKTVIAPLGYEEKTAGACDIYKGAKRTEEVYTTRDLKKVKDLDDLEYMCVDGDKAYIRGETWKNKAKESCKCTADIEIECE